LDSVLKMTDASSPYNYSFDSKTLSNGTHTLSAKAYDLAGNTRTASISVTVNNPDTTAPSVPANLHSTASTSTSVSLGWSASTDSGTNATGVAKYNVLRNGVVVAQPTTTSYTDSSLTANTTYSYVVQAVDGAGNVSASSSTLAVKTATAPDTTAPATPANLQATPVDVDQVNLSWNASTDTGGSGLAGYNVYRNGSKLNSSLITATSFGDTTVSANTTYNYQVEAVDGAGNKSVKSTSVSATTPTVKKGDLSGPNGTPDGIIDLRDISFVIREYGKSGSPADISGPNGTPDGIVDLRDISYLIRNYGT
jgi:chitodextrinase